MEPDRMKSFSHLFKALRAGCPPHAGLAIGFDRLIAVMTGQNSVRDVIAFPKDNSGKDLLVKSPSRLSKRQLLDYHIQVMKPRELNMEEGD
jgi:aspartyl-tRNA synthetase